MKRKSLEKKSLSVVNQSAGRVSCGDSHLPQHKLIYNIHIPVYVDVRVCVHT